MPSSTATTKSTLAKSIQAEADLAYSGSVSDNHCGPDITDFLVTVLNEFMNFKPIQDAKSWWDSGTQGNQANALWLMAVVFYTGGPGDIKERFRAIHTDHCPSGDCDSTVTICGKCYDVDVTGNILFGVVGKTIGIPEDILHKGAAIAQAIATNVWVVPPKDTPADASAINVGFCIYSKANGADASISRDMLCECLSEAKGLNTKPSCTPCDEKWTPGH